MTFLDAIVPLYPKLRLTAEELLEFSVDLFPPVRVLAGQRDDVYAEPRFMLGGEYLRMLHDRPIDHGRIIQLCTSLALSRYVGVTTWMCGEEWILDAIYDTTDLRRGDASCTPLLALVPRDPDWLRRLEQFRPLRFGDRPVIG
jgi:hypothetical protein